MDGAFLQADGCRLLPAVSPESSSRNEGVLLAVDVHTHAPSLPPSLHYSSVSSPFCLQPPQLFCSGEVGQIQTFTCPGLWCRNRPKLWLPSPKSHTQPVGGNHALIEKQTPQLHLSVVFAALFLHPVKKTGVFPKLLAARVALPSTSVVPGVSHKFRKRHV